MIQLSAEPVWLDLLPGVRARFRPIGRAALRRAREAVRGVYAAQGEGARQEAGDAFSDELIRSGLLEWEGIGDAAGEPLAATPEAVSAFLEDPVLFEAADAAYVLPWLARDAEKNGSAPSSNGTSTGATPAAATASSPAAPGAASDAESAPTGSMSPGPTPEKP